MTSYKIVLITTDNDYFISDDTFTYDEAKKKQADGFTIVATETTNDTTVKGIKALKEKDDKIVEAQQKADHGGKGGS